MIAYAEVDSVIEAWVKATGSTLFTEWADKPARFFHNPGAPPHECFQISIKPPSGDKIVLFARAIDTNDDTEMEMEQTWEGPISGLDAMLASAVATIERWKARPLQSHD